MIKHYENLRNPLQNGFYELLVIPLLNVGLTAAGWGSLFGALGSAGSLLGGFFGGSDQEDQAYEQLKMNWMQFKAKKEMYEKEIKERRTQIEGQLKFQEKWMSQELADQLRALELEATPASIGGYDPTMDIAKMNADNRRMEAVRLIQNQRATFGAAGVEVEGSPTQVMAATMNEGERQARQIMQVAAMEMASHPTPTNKADLMLQLNKKRLRQAFTKEMESIKMTRDELDRREALEAEWMSKGKLYQMAALGYQWEGIQQASQMSFMKSFASFFSGAGSWAPSLLKALS